MNSRSNSAAMDGLRCGAGSLGPNFASRSAASRDVRPAGLELTKCGLCSIAVRLDIKHSFK
jgi:hypothetical protein